MPRPAVLSPHVPIWVILIPEAPLIVSALPNWTAYQNGIIIGAGYDITNYGSFITINGRKIGSLTGDIKQRTFFYANVSKGDTLYIDANDVNAVFIPYYGN